MRELVRILKQLENFHGEELKILDSHYNTELIKIKENQTKIEVHHKITKKDQMLYFKVK